MVCAIRLGEAPKLNSICSNNAHNGNVNEVLVENWNFRAFAKDVCVYIYIHFISNFFMLIIDYMMNQRDGWILSEKRHDDM